MKSIDDIAKRMTLNFYAAFNISREESVLHRKARVSRNHRIDVAATIDEDFYQKSRRLYALFHGVEDGLEILRTFNRNAGLPESVWPKSLGFEEQQFRELSQRVAQVKANDPTSDEHDDRLATRPGDPFTRFLGDAELKLKKLRIA